MKNRRNLVVVGLGVVSCAAVACFWLGWSGSNRGVQQLGAEPPGAISDADNRYDEPTANLPMERAAGVGLASDIDDERRMEEGPTADQQEKESKSAVSKKSRSKRPRKKRDPQAQEEPGDNQDQEGTREPPKRRFSGSRKAPPKK